MGWSRVVVLSAMGALLAVGAGAAKKEKRELADNEMAVEVYGGTLLVARGSVNGIRNLRFLLDTGATNTAIDRKLAVRLGLRGQPAHVINFDKKVALERTAVQEMAFGPERIANARVMIEDLRYLGLVGADLDGVIGLDLLRRQSFLVDYGRKRVKFGPVAAGGACEGMRGVPMYGDATSITVEVELDGRPVKMVADTGTVAAVFYEDTLDKMPVNYSLEGTIKALSLGGRVQNRMAIVPRLCLGGQDLDREVVLITAPGASRLSGLSGYLGLRALGAKEIAFDFEGSRLLWKK